MRNHVWLARVALNRGRQSGEITVEQARKIEAVLNGRSAAAKEKKAGLLRDLRGLARKEGWKPRDRKGRVVAVGAGSFWSVLVSILQAIDWGKIIALLLALL